ncbi:MAG TPA: hypothetical protein VHE55_11220 [Fimbriimonadaceae bacterium]|nr:hypothetical protein [Fimbriimonadaceae bacterium]
MKANQKRALGAVVGAGATLVSALLGAYLRAPAEVRVAVFGLISAVAAYWQIEVSPAPEDEGSRR